MAGIEGREVLESWKEISDYLKRTVKTCQRWEQELDLPIRRLDGTPRARVFAYQDELAYWLKDKLDNQDTTTKYLRIAKTKSKRLWIVLPVILALILLAVIAIRFIPAIDFITAPPAKPHLAVLPIKNHTGNDSNAYLEDALTNLIVSKLYQSKYLRIMTVERMNGILKDLGKLNVDTYTTEDLEYIASLDKVTHFLTGFVTKFGDKFRLNISIQESRKWKPIWSGQTDGTESDMFDMVDLLTRTFKPELNLSDAQLADDFDPDVTEVVTTSNPRAYQFYIQAHKAMNDTEWELAIKLFERATALDPDFAMAYRWMSGVFNHLALETGDQSYWDKLREAGQKSREAAVRRPPSERERLIIEGAYIDPASVSSVMKETKEIFKKLLELYPDDDYGNYRMASWYYQGEDYNRAEKYLMPIVGFTNNAFSYYLLSNVNLRQGKYGEARDLLELGMERFPNNFYLFQRMAEFHVLQQEFDEALFWCHRGFEVEPIQFRDSLVKGDVLLFMGDFAAAEEEYRNCLGSNNNKTRIDAAVSLMQLYKTQGRYKDAWMQAETAMQTLEKNVGWDFDPFHAELSRLNLRYGNSNDAKGISEKIQEDSIRLKLYGDIFISTGQWSKMDEVFHEVDLLVQTKNSSEWGIYLAQNDVMPPFSKRLKKSRYYLQARLALETGDYESAISFVELAKELYSGVNLIPADLIDIAGETYFRSGDWELARDQYDWISRMTYSRKEHGDIYAKSFYMLGKIYTQLGKTRDAKRYYDRYLTLWQYSDPGIPEIDDARNRLAALQ